MSGPVKPAARLGNVTVALPTSTPPRVIKVPDVAANVTLPRVATSTLSDGSMDQVILHCGRPVTLGVYLEANPGYSIVV
jgi:hypothetical protein